MSLVAIVVGAGLLLLAAYHTYGRWLTRQLGLRPEAPTPACEVNDGVDFVPTAAPYLLSQHFSAIAAAGPIVGPIAAGLLFGWGPALLWILVGSIFIGGVHDLGSLVASVRHRARSIAEIVREHVGRRAYLLFLSFVWIALIYIVVAFTDLTATTFAPAAPALPAAGAGEAAEAAFRAGETAVATGREVASSSMLYLALAVVMGLALRFGRLSLGKATAIFMPLVLAAIWAGPHLPLGLPSWIWWGGSAARTWDILLLVYCGIASIVPVWALLQPRGYLGGYFLSATVLLALLGMVVGTVSGEPLGVTYPMFRGGWSAVDERTGQVAWLFPVLFVTVACGACSGFHALISSGTSSKQLRSEGDARLVGYGAMLLEAFVAVISLACLMVLARGGGGSPDQIFARGVARFIGFLARALAVDVHVAESYLYRFALLAFATFIYDTLDVCTRLGRYVLQEFTGWRGRAGRLTCTVLTLLPPLALVTQTLTVTDPASGRVFAVPAWKKFWLLFGTANQLLAALTLVGITVWLLRSGRSWWYAALPALFMMAVTFTSLSGILWEWSEGLRRGAPFDPNGPLCSVLFVLALFLLLEAMLAMRRSLRSRAAQALRRASVV